MNDNPGVFKILFSFSQHKQQKHDSKSLKEHCKVLDIYRQRSIYYLIFFMFMSSINFTAVIPSLYPYLKYLKNDVSILYNGFSVSSYSLGQMIASPLFGFVSVKLPVKMPHLLRHLTDLNSSRRRRGAKHLIIFGMFLEIFGSLIYVSARELPTDMLRIWSVILARLVIGFGVGAGAIYRGYVNSASTSKELNFHNTILTVAQSLGFIVGPAIQYLLTWIPPESHIDVPGFRFNTYTAIGHLTVLLTFITIIMAYFLFDEVYPSDIEKTQEIACSIAKDEKEYFGNVNGTLSKMDEDAVFKETLLSGQETSKKNEESIRNNKDDQLDMPLLILCLVMYFIVFAAFIGFESLLNPICMIYLGWEARVTTAFNAITMVIAAVASIVIMLILYKLMMRFTETVFVFISFFLIVISCVLIIPLFSPGPPLNPIVLNDTIREQFGYVKIPDHKKIISMANGVDLIPYSTYSNSNFTDYSSKLEIGGCDIRTSAFCYEDVGLTLTQIMVSFTIFLFGYSIAYLSVYQIFAKTIVNCNGNFWMGWLTAVGSLSRFISPTLISSIFPFRGTLYPFTLLGSVTLVNLIFLCVFFFYRRKRIECNEKKKTETGKTHNLSMIIPIDMEFKSESELQTSENV